MANINLIQDVSDSLVSATEAASKAVVRVDDGTRFTASGLVWSKDGLIVATSHGVESDEGVIVILDDGRKLSATVVGRDPGSDIALLKVSEALEPPTLANGARRGELVLAVGRPGERGLQVSLGIVSALDPRGVDNLYFEPSGGSRFAAPCAGSSQQGNRGENWRYHPHREVSCGGNS
jgi:S1-C subfamily serine protease